MDLIFDYSDLFYTKSTTSVTPLLLDVDYTSVLMGVLLPARRALLAILSHLVYNKLPSKRIVYYNDDLKTIDKVFPKAIDGLKQIIELMFEGMSFEIIDNLDGNYSRCLLVLDCKRESINLENAIDIWKTKKPQAILFSYEIPHVIERDLGMFLYTANNSESQLPIRIGRAFYSYLGDLRVWLHIVDDTLEKVDTNNLIGQIIWFTRDTRERELFYIPEAQFTDVQKDSLEHLYYDGNSAAEAFLLDKYFEMFQLSKEAREPQMAKISDLITSLTQKENIIETRFLQRKERINYYRLK